VDRAVEPAPKGRVLHHPVDVQGTARLATGGPADEIERLRTEPGEGDIAIGGATLAAEAAAFDLIDEYRTMATRSWSAAASPTSPTTNAGRTSNSSSTAPSARTSSTSATA